MYGLAQTPQSRMIRYYAGDKQFYYYLGKVREQLELVCQSSVENMLERTDSKRDLPILRLLDAEPCLYTVIAGKIKLLRFMQGSI